MIHDSKLMNFFERIKNKYHDKILKDIIEDYQNLVDKQSKVDKVENLLERINEEIQILKKDSESMRKLMKTKLRLQTYHEESFLAKDEIKSEKIESDKFTIFYRSISGTEHETLEKSMKKYVLMRSQINSLDQKERELMSDENQSDKVTIRSTESTPK